MWYKVTNLYSRFSYRYPTLWKKVFLVGFLSLYTANFSPLVVCLAPNWCWKVKDKSGSGIPRSHVIHCFQEGSWKAEAVFTRTGLTKQTRKGSLLDLPCGTKFLRVLLFATFVVVFTIRKKGSLKKILPPKFSPQKFTVEIIYKHRPLHVM